MHNRALRCGGLAGLLVLFAGCAGGVDRAELIEPGGVVFFNQEPVTRGEPVLMRSVYDGSLDGLFGLEALEKLASQEAEKPSPPAIELVQRILGEQFVLAEEGTEAHGRAVMATDVVLGDAVDAMGAGGELDGDIEGGEDEDLVPLIPQLAKGYVRARAAMLDEDYAQAVAIYEQLAQASPDSTEILVGLGDALMGNGDRARGAAVYLDAVERGDRSMRAMVMSAIGLQGRGGQSEGREQMLGIASLAWMDETNPDRAGRVLGGIVLGQALLEDGYYNAGAEVLESALSMLDREVLRDARYRTEMVQLFSKRADRMAAAGDAWLLLGEADRAERMYGLAGEMVTAEPVGLLSRKVATKLLAGQSGRGALMLLEWLDANPGNESRELGNLAATISDHRRAGILFAQELSSMIEDGNRTASSRRALLKLQLDIEEFHWADGGGFGVHALATTDAALVTPVLGSRVLGGIEDDSERVQAALMIVDRNPAAAVALAQALVRVDGQPIALMERIAEAGGRGKSEPADLLRCLVALDLQRPDLLELDDLQIDDGASTAWLIAHARAAALGARWALSSRLFDLAGDRFDEMSVTEWAFYCDSLVAANRMGDAISAVEALVDREGTTAAEWVVAARISQKVGAPEAMAGSLQRALELDGYDEAVYEQLIALYTNTNSGDGADSSDNAEGLRNLTRLLAQRLPDSALVKLIRANEMAGASLRGSDGGGATGQGSALLQQSERLLLELAEENPWREIGIDLLLSIWATEAAQGDPRGAQRGLALTAFRMESLPGSVELASARARLMVLTGDDVGAEGYLDSLYERMPSRQVGRLHEGLIRSEEGRRSEADALSIDRLDGLVSVGDGLERMERSVVVGPMTAVRFNEFDADELIPGVGVDGGPEGGPDGGEWMYGSGQALRVVRVLASVVQGNTDQATNDLVLELIERARVRVDSGLVSQEIDVASAFNQIELLALPNSSDFSIDAYERVVRGQVASQDDDSMIGIAVQSLMRARDTSAGMDLLTRLTVQGDGVLDGQRVVELSSLLAQGGTSDDVARSVGYLEDLGYLVEARNAVTEGFGTLSEEYRAEDTNTESVRADWIYSVAVVASFYERDAVAESMYRLALASDPEHAWANNDLGYKMVEDGRNLEEATAMLRTAHEREPGAASITDSLGWVLYAIGQLEDEVDDSGKVISQGARSLLEEAISIDPENATIHDHLGDVLWLLGEFEMAVESWLEAEEVLRGRLTELSNQEIANPRAVELMREELSRVRQKISDAESGRLPGVAPSEWSEPAGVWDDTVEP